MFKIILSQTGEQVRCKRCMIKYSKKEKKRYKQNPQQDARNPKVRSGRVWRHWGCGYGWLDNQELLWETVQHLVTV